MKTFPFTYYPLIFKMIHGQIRHKSDWEIVCKCATCNEKLDIQRQKKKATLIKSNVSERDSSFFPSIYSF